MAEDERSAANQRLVQELLDGDELALSRVISHIENRESGYRDIVDSLVEHTGTARTIGVTGPPGAGKSTLVDRLVEQYRERGETVGVVAVDPASPYTGGSILGDRIRQSAMQNDDNVFFRSMSARNRTGGLAVATCDAVRALDAFGKDVIMVETVGSGQSEIEVVQATDTVCVVLFPGAGDDVQMNKAGILEIADAFAVNKADLSGVDDVVARLQEMLQLGSNDDWSPPIIETVATSGDRIGDLVDAFDEHQTFLRADDRLSRRRQEQFRYETVLHARERLLTRLEATAADLDFNESADSPHAVARKLLEEF